jgi:hypothetical protein
VPTGPGGLTAAPSIFVRRIDLFNDFFDAAGTRIHDHHSIIHNRISVTRPYMVLGRKLVERHAHLWQQHADAHLLTEPERLMVLMYDEFVKPRPLFDDQDLGLCNIGQASHEQQRKRKQAFFHVSSDLVWMAAPVTWDIGLRLQVHYGLLAEKKLK